MTLANYPSYIGFDISSEAIKLCQELFDDDINKSFRQVDIYKGELAELTLSIDVIYHFIEDKKFELYMERLFSSSTRHIIIYSSNSDEKMAFQSPHIRHRIFTNWIMENHPQWKLVRVIQNRYPLYKFPGEGSPSNFYIYSNEYSIKNVGLIQAV